LIIHFAHQPSKIETGKETDGVNTFLVSVYGLACRSIVWQKNKHFFEGYIFQKH